MEIFEITIEPTVLEDLKSFFHFQLDEEATYLAAFTLKDPHNKIAYLEKYTKHLNDPSIVMRTIKVNNEIVGSIAKFEIQQDVEITYWIDKKFWGKGVATYALKEILKIVPTRPIYGRAAFDNFGSHKVLEKCGFQKIGTDIGFANARKCEVEEYIYLLLL